MESYRICCYVVGFFQLRCFQGSSMLYLTVLHSFLWLNNTTLCVYRCVCVYIYIYTYAYIYIEREREHFIYPSAVNGRLGWVFYIFLLLWIMPLWTFLYKLLCKNVFFSSLEYMPRSGLSGTYDNCFTQWVHHFINTFSKQYIGVPVSPHSCQHSLLSVFLIITILENADTLLLMVESIFSHF